MLKLNLTSKEILNKLFAPSDKGYNAYDVDEFLDKIIQDYKLVEDNVLLLNKEFEEKDLKIKKLEEEKSALEIELGKYKARFSNIKAEDNVTTDNIELLKRINLLEKALYNAGIDPSKI